MTWDIYQDPETGHLILVPTGEPAPDGFIYEAVTANPDYLTQDNVR